MRMEPSPRRDGPEFPGVQFDPFSLGRPEQATRSSGNRAFGLQLERRGYDVAQRSLTEVARGGPPDGTGLSARLGRGSSPEDWLQRCPRWQDSVCPSRSIRHRPEVIEGF
jgi:hypothetical protein